MMNSQGQSDGGIVPKKSSNNPVKTEAERMEGRPPAKGKADQSSMPRTQGRKPGMSVTLTRLREAVKRDKKAKLTALYHHIYAEEHLREGYYALKRQAAAGVDEVTWQAYGQELDKNLQDLSARLRRGAYQATPVRRTYIPKADGRQRPLGVLSLEDKIVQWVTAQLLTTVWEEEFLAFSYGFRPRRSPHQALDALALGIERRRVKWVLDMDIRAFYDTLSHEWLAKFLQHRIGDQRVVHLVQKWLQVGVLEDGRWTPSEEGTPQGGIVSPVLANIYLHYAFDLWVQQWRQQRAHGDVIVVRFADDAVLGFEYRKEAEQFWQALAERLGKFKLELHADKTRLIEFGCYAASNRVERGEGKPETFNFLGFTHICGRTRKGAFTVLRQTMPKRMQAKLKEIKQELERRRHDPVPEIGQWLRSVVNGYYQYHGIPRNQEALKIFHLQVVRLWKHALERRSQKHHLTWERMDRLARRWIPTPRICQPYPNQRFRVMTQGKSRMR